MKTQIILAISAIVGFASASNRVAREVETSPVAANGGEITRLEYGVFGETVLHKAAAEGKLEAVKELISRKFNVNAVDFMGRIALHSASEKGHVDVVRVLIENEPSSIATRDSRGWTALFWACQNGHFDVVSFLIENGAIVTDFDSAGNTPLHVIRTADERIPRLLIEHGANVMAVNDFGRAPIHEACAHQYNSVFIVLIANGADINAKDLSGKTPIDFIPRYFPEVVEMMRHIDSVCNEDVALIDHNGQTILHRECIAGVGLDVIMNFVRRGGDFTLRDAYGKTSLDYATVTYNVLFFCVLAEMLPQDSALRNILPLRRAHAGDAVDCHGCGERIKDRQTVVCFPCGHKACVTCANKMGLGGCFDCHVARLMTLLSSTVLQTERIGYTDIDAIRSIKTVLHEFKTRLLQMEWEFNQ